MITRGGVLNAAAPHNTFIKGVHITMRCANQNQRYMKSALTVYNNATQTLNPSVAGGAVVVAGTNTTTDTGCSIASTSSGGQVLCSGLYDIEVNLTFNLVAGPGVVNFQLLQNGVPLPCAQAGESALVDDTRSVSFGTRICVNTCSANQPIFTILATSTTATEINVTHVCLKILKDA